MGNVRTNTIVAYIVNRWGTDAGTSRSDCGLFSGDASGDVPASSDVLGSIRSPSRGCCSAGGLDGLSALEEAGESCSSLLLSPQLPFMNPQTSKWDNAEGRYPLKAAEAIRRPPVNI